MSDAPTGSGPEAADTTRAEAESRRTAINHRCREADRMSTLRDSYTVFDVLGLLEALRRDALYLMDAFDLACDQSEQRRQQLAEAHERHQDAMVTLSAGHVRAMGEARVERDKAVEQARADGWNAALAAVALTVPVRWIAGQPSEEEERARRVTDREIAEAIRKDHAPRTGLR